MNLKMAAPTKKREVDLSEKKSSGSEKREFGEYEKIEEGLEIQVDFEGRNPVDSDFHGIKQLLTQLFLKSHLNLTELSNLIIRQNYIGSVIKQSEIDESDEDDDDNANSDDVFGVTTVINLTDKQNLECVTQLRSLILKVSSHYGSPEVASFMKDILSGGKKTVGLLINERFVNIPAQIIVPLLKSLKDELKVAVEKKMDYDFSYLLLICKFYKMDNAADSKKSKSSKKSNTSEIIWSNPEEEIINQEAEVQFEFSVKDEADYGLVGDWKENDQKLIPMRRILVIPFERFDKIIEKVEEAVSA